MKIETLHEKSASEILFTGDINDVIKKLKALKKKYPKYKRISIGIDIDYIFFVGELKWVKNW